MKNRNAKIVSKPWGHERIFAHTDKYVGKVLHIDPGHRLSKQYHEIKDETIFVLSGTLEAYLGDEESKHIMTEGQCLRVPPKTIHRFEAPKGGEPVVLLEVSTPELDDVVRLEDDYERVSIDTLGER